MSTTESTPATTPFSSTPTTSVVNNSPDATLGKDDFLQLLVAQLQNQDPTQPTDSTAFVSQLAQFSALEQQTDTNQTMTGLAATTAINQGIDLLGRNVSFTRPDNSTGSGIVDSISLSSGAVVVDVGGESIDPSEITDVGQAPTAPTQSTSTNQ
jgi:flagellar basal-body rod modification protein FlgD